MCTYRDNAMDRAGVQGFTALGAMRSDCSKAYDAMIAAAPEAPAEAQGNRLLELFKHTLGSLALHDQAEAQRIGKLYRDAQSSGNTGELAQGKDTRSAVVLAALMDAPRDIAARATTTPQGNMAQGEDSARLRALLRAVVQGWPGQYDNRPPGHSHRIPGIWDDYNGPKSGTECTWCKTWGEAIAEVERASAETGGVKS